MKALEERAFADGVTAEKLMEEAGEKIALTVRQFFPAAGKCVVFFGKGHNGGDGFVAMPSEAMRITQYDPDDAVHCVSQTRGPLKFERTYLFLSSGHFEEDGRIVWADCFWIGGEILKFVGGLVDDQMETPPAISSGGS